jgi:2-methylcitrate dehydratase PrpD
MSVARVLAERVAALRYGDLPPEALHWSRVALLDTVGVALAGATEDAPRIAREALGMELGVSGGASLILGTANRAAPLDAACLNAISAHVLDFDNTTNSMGGHVSATMVPALLAAAEAFDANGRDVLAAHVAGFETGARIGRGVNFHHSEKGWHPTSTLGVFAVAAACSHLLRLDASQTEAALAIATSLAAGHKANFGTMTKSLHTGQCARSGLMAALLARRGFTANEDAFEHKQGFLELFNGSGRYDTDRIIDGWGEPFDIVTPGAGYKQYPCCASTQGAIDAALDLVRVHGRLAPDAVERIETETPPRGLLHTDRPLPQSALEAKFSVQYCVVRALLSGDVLLRDFEGDAYREPAVRRLLALTRSRAQSEKPFGATVTVTLRDGTRRSAGVEQRVGKTAVNPVSAERMRTKFEDCASRVLSPHAVRCAYDALCGFDEIASVRKFMESLERSRTLTEDAGIRGRGD